MSSGPESQQSALSAFGSSSDPQPTDETRRADARAWTPTRGDGTQVECRGCGSHVSRQFARVQGDNEDRVHHCPSCVNGTDLAQGAAANPDFESRTGNSDALRGSR